jgi:cell division protein FtsN
VKETQPASPAAKPAEKPAATPSPAPATPARKEAPKTDAPKQTAAAKPAATAASKWVVRAGTFMYVEGARERLEEVINAGFPDAEISKTKDGKFTVLVSRTADKAAALRTVEKLENKGVEAAVFTQ